MSTTCGPAIGKRPRWRTADDGSQDATGAGRLSPAPGRHVLERPALLQQDQEIHPALAVAHAANVFTVIRRCAALTGTDRPRSVHRQLTCAILAPQGSVRPARRAPAKLSTGRTSQRQIPRRSAVRRASLVGRHRRCGAQLAAGVERTSHRSPTTANRIFGSKDLAPMCRSMRAAVSPRRSALPPAGIAVLVASLRDTLFKTTVRDLPQGPVSRPSRSHCLGHSATRSTNVIFASSNVRASGIAVPAGASRSVICASSW